MYLHRLGFPDRCFSERTQNVCSLLKSLHLNVTVSLEGCKPAVLYGQEQQGVGTTELKVQKLASSCA